MIIYNVYQIFNFQTQQNQPRGLVAIPLHPPATFEVSFVNIFFHRVFFHMSRNMAIFVGVYLFNDCNFPFL